MTTIATGAETYIYKNEITFFQTLSRYGQYQEPRSCAQSYITRAGTPLRLLSSHIMQFLFSLNFA